MERFGRHILVLLSTCFTLQQQLIAQTSSTKGIPFPTEIYCKNGNWVSVSNSLTRSCEEESYGDPVLYWSFDTLDNLFVMEGNTQTDSDPRVVGKKCSAVSTNISEQQWIDLGTHTEACLTHPNNCSTTGGAVSLWYRRFDCPTLGGIISARSELSDPGFSLHCTSTKNNYVVFLTNGLFHVGVSKSTEWVHSVTNFVGPNNGQGIRVYHDGQLIGQDSKKSTFSSSQNPANGKISIGKFDRYASVQMDELYFFNRVLSRPKIKILSL